VSTGRRVEGGRGSNILIKEESVRPITYMRRLLRGGEQKLGGKTCKKRDYPDKQDLRGGE